MQKALCPPLSPFFKKKIWEHNVQSFLVLFQKELGYKLLMENKNHSANLNLLHLLFLFFWIFLLWTTKPVDLHLCVTLSLVCKIRILLSINHA